MTTEIHQETEVKVKIDSIKVIRQQISACGFRLSLGRHFERNLVFDFADLGLRQKGILLRLRQAGEKCLLTMKSPVKGQDLTYKIRDEMEVELANCQVMETILCGLGLEVFFIYEKYREVYSGQSVSLMLDETPLGAYLEIEGTPESIDHVAHQLGFQKKEYIGASYFQLFRQSGQHGHMVFPK